jgi:hypothetical protein
MNQRQKVKPGVQDYDFFRFEALFAFALGAFGATFLILVSGGVLFVVVWVAAIFGTAFGLIHLFNTWRRRRFLDKRTQRAIEEERERRALAARANASLANEEASPAAARRRRRRRGRPTA